MSFKSLTELGFLLRNYVVGTEGNVSQRTPTGFVIKASGKSLKDLDETSLVSCGKEGKQLIEGDIKPSLESSFHSWIYNNSDFKFIAHTHPTNVLKVLCSTDTHIESFACRRLFPDQVVFNSPRACVVPYSTPGFELANRIEGYVSNYIDMNHSFPSLILLKNHGIICCANSVNEAVAMTEICDKSAEIYVGAANLSGPTFLTTANINELLNHKGEKHRKKIL